MRVGWRLPAREVEQAVQQTVTELLDDRVRLAAALRDGGIEADHLPAALDGLARWRRRSTMSQAILTELVQRVVVSATDLQLTLAVPSASGAVPTLPLHAASGVGRPAIVLHDHRTANSFEHRMAHQLRRRGNEMRLIIAAASPARRDDPAMLKMIARAHAWFDELASGRCKSIRELTERLGLQRSYVQRLLPLALLAPALVEQIVVGEQPAGLTAEWLQRNAALPACWSQQTALLGA